MKNNIPSITILGGTGKMGQWLKHFFEEHGITPQIYGKDYKKHLAELKKADIVIVGVTIAQTEEVITTIHPYLAKTSLLADITSVKIMPLAAMEKAPCATLGMHPLFGPGIGSLIGQKIVFCRQKDNQYVAFLKNLFEKSGLEVVEMSAEEHDYQLAYIQALTHATHLLYAKTLLGQEKTVFTKLQTPTFALHALAMGRILNQDIDMMAGIQCYNPYFIPVFTNLMENSNKLLKILEKGDTAAFADFFVEEQQVMKNFSALSTFQTNKILRMVSEGQPMVLEKFPMQTLLKGSRISYLGPQGTYSYQAAMLLFKDAAYKKIAYQTIFEVFQSILVNESNCGIVPAENSIEGTVRGTIDYLIEFSLYVSGSFEIPIHHQLLSREKRLAEIHTVVSHPQALAQCKKWLKENLPQAKLVASDSTTAALPTTKKGHGYIASTLAAKEFSIPILKQNIEDDVHNTTRFYAITKSPVKLTGVSNKKTLLFMTVYNRVGILRDILDVFAKHNINLTKLESRPSHEKVWDYHFFVEVEKEENDKELIKALKALEVYCPVIRILGRT